MKLTDLNLLREQAYIDGQWIEADDEARFAVTNPANGELIAEVASLGRTETARAIDAAQAALPAWRGKTAKERSSILRNWFNLILENQEDLARLLSWEQGKPLAESRGEIAYGASFIEWFAEEAKRIYGDVIPHDKQGRRLVVIKQAIGVVAAITPWNFPNAMITRKVGPADDEGAQQGPLINAKAVAKVQEHIEDALGKGAKVLAGGKPHRLGGNFFEPTVLGDVTPDMLVARDETFGPLAPIFRFDSEEQAIAMANDTEFGLASYLYTRDLGRAWRVSEALEYGMVGVNEGLISTEVAPFGGIKQSGLGREGSRYGIDDYIELKYMCLGIH